MWIVFLFVSFSTTQLPTKLYRSKQERCYYKSSRISNLFVTFLYPVWFLVGDLQRFFYREKAKKFPVLYSLLVFFFRRYALRVTRRFIARNLSRFLAGSTKAKDLYANNVQTRKTSSFANFFTARPFRPRITQKNNRYTQCILSRRLIMDFVTFLSRNHCRKKLQVFLVLSGKKLSARANTYADLRLS